MKNVNDDNLYLSLSLSAIKVITKMCNFRVYDTIRDKRISLLSCKGISRLNSTTTKSQTQKVRWNTFWCTPFDRASRNFSPLGKKHKNPRLLVIRVASVNGFRVWPAQTLRARQGNQSAKRIGVSSFFLFFFRNSLERIVNKLARHNPDQGRDGIVSWKKRKNVARFSHPTFREPFESRRADGWRTDHLAVTTIVRRRCY